MYYKEQRYEKAKASTFAATHTVTLPDTGLVDSISLYFRAQNSASPQSVAPSDLLHHITKIEIIGDTDKTIFSMTGECAMAKAYRKIGALPAFTQNEYGEKTQDLHLPIFFGRKFHDGKYALDISQWDKVDLKVTNDATTSFFVAGSVNMETRLCTIEDATQAYGRYLKQWEYQTDVPNVAGDYVRPKLPTKGLLRSLMIQLDPVISATTGAMTADPISDSYNWKLWFKDRALTIYDHRVKDIMRDEHRRLGLGISSSKPYPSTTHYTDMNWANVQSVAIASIDESGSIKTAPNMEDQSDRFQKLANLGTATFYQAIAQGIGYRHTFEIPWFTADEEAEYLNLDAYKPVEIEWYGYNYYNTHRIILEKPVNQGSAGYE